MEGSEGIVDVEVSKLRQTAGKWSLVCHFLLIKTYVLKEEDRPLLAVIDRLLNFLSHTVIELMHRVAKEGL